MSTDEKYPPDEVQRWTAKRRAALITSILRGETSAQEAARKHGLTVAEIEDWKEKAVAAMTESSSVTSLHFEVVPKRLNVGGSLHRLRLLRGRGVTRAAASSQFK
jgi:hypothetical protein